MQAVASDDDIHEVWLAMLKGVSAKKWLAVALAALHSDAHADHAHFAQHFKDDDTFLTNGAENSEQKDDDGGVSAELALEIEAPVISSSKDKRVKSWSREQAAKNYVEAASNHRTFGYHLCFWHKHLWTMTLTASNCVIPTSLGQDFDVNDCSVPVPKWASAVQKCQIHAVPVLLSLRGASQNAGGPSCSCRPQQTHNTSVAHIRCTHPLRATCCMYLSDVYVLRVCAQARTREMRTRKTTQYAPASRAIQTRRTAWQPQ